MSGAHSDRRWEELARELEFTQLNELRRQAEGWRTGLTGLTGLMAVLAILKGKDSLTGLPVVAQVAATTLIAVAFCSLLAGSLFAIRAASGRPGEEIVRAGQALRRWTEREAGRIGRALKAATACCLVGLVAIVAAVIVTWAATGEPPINLVRVSATEGAAVCGELVSAGPNGVTLWAGSGDRRTLRIIPANQARTVTAVKSCP